MHRYMLLSSHATTSTTLPPRALEAMNKDTWPAALITGAHTTVNIVNTDFPGVAGDTRGIHPTPSPVPFCRCVLPAPTWPSPTGLRHGLASRRFSSGRGIFEKCIISSSSYTLL